MSPSRSIFPGRRAHLAPVAGVAGVLATAITGIFLAFTSTQEAPPQRAAEFDQESTLSPRSDFSYAPAGLSTSPSDGSFQETPKSRLPPPAWVQAVPPPESEITVGPPLTAEPPLAPVVGPLGSTTGPPASVTVPPPPVPPPPVTAPPGPRRSAAPEPPHRSATPLPPHPKVLPAPQVPPQEQPAPSISGKVAADPCATFHDFRREPCYAYLNRLTR
ncbi:hypothetical protein GCM10020216_021620 [Nonomuraea helvata]